MAITVYGINNCTTVKKARKWLEGMGLDYRFHDYKRSGVPSDRLRAWVAAEGWESLLNRRGTTFRKLDEVDQSHIDEGKAILLMETHPSLIKRPVVEYSHEDGEGLLVGFDAPRWTIALGGSLT